MNEGHHDPLKRHSDLEAAVANKAHRKLRARREDNRSIWFGLGMYGLIGWSVAVPTLLGISLGVWIDNQWPGKVSWTLTFLFIGIVLGCLNAWHWVKQEGPYEETNTGDVINKVADKAINNVAGDSGNPDDNTADDKEA